MLFETEGVILLEETGWQRQPTEVNLLSVAAPRHEVSKDPVVPCASRALLAL